MKDGNIIRSLLLKRRELVAKYIKEQTAKNIVLAKSNEELDQIDRMLRDIRYDCFNINNEGVE